MTRKFSQMYEPSEKTKRYAWVNNERIYEEASDYLTFWDSLAKSDIEWFEPYREVLNSGNAPFYEWFVGGKINIVHNCLDRHLESRGDKTAIIWQGEPENEKERITYNELHRKVCKFANALRTLGVGEGDIVTIYMGMGLSLLLLCLHVPESVQSITWFLEVSQLQP